MQCATLHNYTTNKVCEITMRKYLPNTARIAAATFLERTGLKICMRRAAVPCLFRMLLCICIIYMQYRFYTFLLIFWLWFYYAYTFSLALQIILIRCCVVWIIFNLRTPSTDRFKCRCMIHCLSLYILSISMLKE